MKREEIPFYVYGFSDGEVGLFSRGMRQLQVIPVTTLTIRSWLGKPDVSVCAVRISSEEDLNLFRQLRVEYPMHSWGACVDPGHTSFLSQLLCREGFVLFLHPLEKESLSIAIQRLLGNIFKGRIQASVHRGLRVMHQSYRWKTDEIEVQAVAQLIAGQLEMGEFCFQGRDKDAAVLAIEEALINAVEHGNLELDSALKEQDIMGLAYEAEKTRRLLDKMYSARRVSIELSIDRDKAACTIMNEGPEFDFEAELDRADAVECLEKASGKGIFLIKRVFDRIIYSDGGKSVTLVKHKKPEVFL
ncbi:MAG: ATP-binding protein [Spirochaetales bacterium]|nr:ATP-binding protein [Spirochaetales bacterium]